MAGSLGGGGPCPDPQVGESGGFPRLLGRGCPAQEGALRVVPRNREPRSESLCQRAAVSSSGWAGPKLTGAPLQTMPTAGPGDTLRCPSGRERV